VKLPSLRKTEPRPAAVAAATWWADKLGLALTNGTDDGMSAALQMYAQSLRPLPTGDEATKFVEVLAAAIEANLASLADVKLPMVTLGVDYGPDAILGDAARAAGVRAGFPMKTCMWVTSEVVTASLGYGASERLVWASEEWLSTRPACGSQEWRTSDQFVEDYHGEPFVCSLPLYHEERSHRYDQPIALCAASGRREGGATHDPEGWMGARAHAFTPKPA
jgi:hypothetical protein